MNRPIHIISTTDLPSHLLERLKEYNISVDVIPFIKTSVSISETDASRINKLASSKAVVAFTSVHSVNAVADLLDRQVKWSIYCLNGATIEAVKDRFGDHCIAGSAANSSALAEVIKTKPHSKLVFFCGNLRRDAIPKGLPAAGISVEEIRVYRTDLTPVKLSRDYDGILFFSPSAVESFFSVNMVEPQQTLFAMGEITAAAIRRYSSNAVFLPAEPGKSGTVDLVIEHFLKHH